MKFPIHIELELTNLCNMNCIMCPHSIMKRSQGFMSRKVFYKAIGEAKDKCRTSYLHQIGEPLLHPNLIEFINYASGANIRTSLSTNCMLLDRVMTEKIIDSSLDEITLCLDSLKKDVYEKIRVGGNFETVRKNIMYFLKRKGETKSPINIQIQMIKMKENEEERDTFRKMFASSGVEVLVKDYSTFGGKVNKGEMVEARRFACNKMNTHITIHWNGDVVPCCRDFEGFEIMGNVGESTLESIFNSSPYNIFRENYKNTQLCEEC